MRIVITGASGNIGTALLRRLAGSGYQLVGVSRRLPPQVAPYDGVQWVQLDLSGDDATDRLTGVFAGADAVVHLAWMLQPSHDRDLMRRTNQGGTRAVADAAQTASVAHLVHMSSLGTYAAAPHGAWADESWPTSGVPSSAYSVDKAAAERIVAGRSYQLTAVRPSLVLQPDAASEISRYFLGRLVPAAIIRPGLVKITPWPQALLLQVVHADDVADAVTRIVEQRAGGAFNLAAAPVLDRQQLRRTFGGLGPPAPLALVRAVAALSWHARAQPTDAGWVDLGAAVPLLRTYRARTVLGWRPQHRADDVLRDLVTAIGARRGAAGPLLYPRAV